jgi:hypothetical protein
MPKSKGRPAYTVRSSSQAAKDREGGSAPSIGDPAPLSSASQQSVDQTV